MGNGKRPTVYFSEEEYDRVQEIAEEQNDSLASVVRSAVREKYIEEAEDDA